MVFGRLAKCGDMVAVQSRPRAGRPFTMYQCQRQDARQSVRGSSVLGKRCQPLVDQGWDIEFEKDWQASNGPLCQQSRPFQPDRVLYVHSVPVPGWVSWPRVWPQWTSEKCGLWSLHKSKHSLATTAGPAERSSFRHRVLSAGMRHATCNMQHGE